ncbi:MAG TPA: hypothetical protein VMT76_02560 [Puia sp.]|nr:hypothetical protein [Puia sp.]
MATKKIYITFIALACLAAGACSNEDKQKTVDSTKDSTSSKGTVQPPNDSTDNMKQADSTTVASPIKATDVKKGVSNKVNDVSKTEPRKGAEAIKVADEKTQSTVAAVADAGKTAARKTDSAVSSAAAKTGPPITKKESKTADDEGLIPANVADNSKSVAPKYGIIPRDANENNISNFKSAFPDQRTLVRINFDADPDTEMQNTKIQIINALKKSGYNNISNKSITFHPSRMPKDIHYELQHDGSVVIWVQPANP